MDYQIRFVKEAEQNAAKELFISCFDSEEREADFFFSPRQKQIIGAFSDDKLCSMFTVFDCEAVLKTESVKASYMAGVATSPEHRGNKLFEKCFDFYLSSSQETELIFCIPASESLFKLYERAGLRDTAYITKQMVVAKPTKQAVYLKKLSAEKNLDEYFSLTDRIYSLNNYQYIKKPRDLQEAALRSFLIYGGNAAIGDDFAVLYRKEKDSIIICDLVCNDFEAGVAKAISALGFEGDVIVILPILPDEKGTKTKIAACMKRSKIDTSGLYINVLFNEI